MTRRLPLIVVAVVVVVAAASGWTLLRDDRRATDADRQALAATGDATGASGALAATVDLAADAERWERLVADGGPDLAALLDRGLPALTGDTSAAGAVVAPLLDDDAVADDVAAPLGRWAWPLLMDPTGDDAVTLLTADDGDGPGPAVAAAVDLARARLATTTVDVDALRDWHQGLDRRRADTGWSAHALMDAANDAETPPRVAASTLAAFADDAPGDASAPLVDALGGWGAEPASSDEPASPGDQMLRVATMLGAIDTREDTAAAVALADVVGDTIDEPGTDVDAVMAAVEDAVFTLDEVEESEAVAFEAQQVLRS